MWLSGYSDLSCSPAEAGTLAGTAVHRKEFPAPNWGQRGPLDSQCPASVPHLTCAHVCVCVRLCDASANEPMQPTGSEGGGSRASLNVLEWHSRRLESLLDAPRTCVQPQNCKKQFFGLPIANSLFCVQLSCACVCKSSLLAYFCLNSLKYTTHGNLARTPTLSPINNPNFPEGRTPPCPPGHSICPSPPGHVEYGCHVHVCV